MTLFVTRTALQQRKIVAKRYRLLSDFGDDRMRTNTKTNQMGLFAALDDTGVFD